MQRISAVTRVRAALDVGRDADAMWNVYVAARDAYYANGEPASAKLALRSLREAWIALADTEDSILAICLA